MPSEKKIKELVGYWIKSSKEDFKVMQGLYKNKHNAWCLFMGHLILEKALKALVVKKTKGATPRTHNLPLLWKLSGIELSEDESHLLFDADSFNMEARYPDEKLDFHKKCTPSYTKKYYKEIISLYKKLCQKVS